MTDYPASVYEPRVVENKAGVEYDPAKVTVPFAEDINLLADEVVAIADDLVNSFKVKGYASVADPLIPSGVDAPIVLDGEAFDPNNLLDSTRKTGTATSTSAGHLVDNVRNQFVAADVGRKIFNTTDKTFTSITAFNSVSDVTLANDIMANGENYTLFNNRITITKAGYYYVNINTIAESCIDQKIYRLYCRTNSGWNYVNQIQSSGGGQVLVAGSLLLYLAVGAWVEPWYYHNSGSDITLDKGVGTTYLTLFKLPA